jgi:DNA repair exonuclease SbcCD ATPase subunit
LDEGLELRPQTDWIVKPNAWPAIIDQETFEQVQARRKQVKQTRRHTPGSSIHASYFLTSCLACGVCGGRLTGQTNTSGKGYRTRYYVCSTHHKGDHERCPTRYKLNADIVEQHILKLIKSDLANLKDDPQLQQYIAEEIARLSGSDDDAREQLQRRLCQLDQQMAKLRDHIRSLDAATATALGFYAEAKTTAAERATVEDQLRPLARKVPTLPDMADIASRANGELERLEQVFAAGTVDEQKELVGMYVKTIKADPNTHCVEISLYPALFTSIIAGGSSACRRRPRTGGRQTRRSTAWAHG